MIPMFRVDYPAPVHLLPIDTGLLIPASGLVRQYGMIILHSKYACDQKSSMDYHETNSTILTARNPTLSMHDAH